MNSRDPTHLDPLHVGTRHQPLRLERCATPGVKLQRRIETIIIKRRIAMPKLVRCVAVAEVGVGRFCAHALRPFYKRVLALDAYNRTDNTVLDLDIQ